MSKRKEKEINGLIFIISLFNWINVLSISNINMMDEKQLKNYMNYH